MQTDEAVVAAKPDKPKSKKVLMFWLHGITFVLGLGLLVLLVRWIGYKVVIESLSKVGWGFVAIIALNVLRHFLRSASMYLAVPKEERTFKYMSAVAARFGGEAVSYMTFTGPFLGDATKAVLLRKKIPLAASASAVLIDNVLYYVTVVMMIIAGVIALVYFYGSGSPAMSRVLIAVVIGAALILFALLLAIWFQIKPLTKVISILDKRGWVPKKVRKVEDGHVFLGDRHSTVEQAGRQQAAACERHHQRTNNESSGSFHGNVLNVLNVSCRATAMVQSATAVRANRS